MATIEQVFETMIEHRDKRLARIKRRLSHVERSHRDLIDMIELEKDIAEQSNDGSCHGLRRIAREAEAMRELLYKLVEEDLQHY